MAYLNELFTAFDALVDTYEIYKGCLLRREASDYLKNGVLIGAEWGKLFKAGRKSRANLETQKGQETSRSGVPASLVSMADAVHGLSHF
eukprot:783774-Pelagomonas_calceolata.AAC.3